MTPKEISVFFIGIMLVGFLYLMKHPISLETQPFSVNNDTKVVGIDIIKTDPKVSFNPNNSHTTIENILDIPAWSFDLTELEERTSDELVTKINQAITQENYFKPENINALFYLQLLKSIDSENLSVLSFSNFLKQKLSDLTEIAIQNSDEQQLKIYIAKIKTLDKNSPLISELKNTLANIKTINKLFEKGILQIQNNEIINQDSQDAWHTAKQCLNVDPQNQKTRQLVSMVNTILTNKAMRAAEETDFQLAKIQLEQAQLLSPESLIVIKTQDSIEQLKQQRYVWLEQQINKAINQGDLNRSQKMYSELVDLGISVTQLSEYQSEISRIKTFGKFKPLDLFNDVTEKENILPTMVVIPIGSFIMGQNRSVKSEAPAHQVTIRYGFAVSKNEISVEDFGYFIASTNHKTDAQINNSSKIYNPRTGRLSNKRKVNWKRNYLGGKSDQSNPVIHVSWNDAQAYTNWLSKQTGKNYRLLSESEFEYILRAGSKSTYPWGNGNPVQITENLAGNKDKFKHNNRVKWKKGFEDYSDDYWGPAPVGNYIPNQFKLNDTAGNVMEWVIDCWHDSYTRAPTNGGSWSNPGCESHVIRGGSWSSAKNEFRSSHRFKAKSDFTDARVGFRIAVDL